MAGREEEIWTPGHREQEGHRQKRGGMRRAEQERGEVEVEVAFVEEGELSQSPGGQGGGEREPQEEVKAEEGVSMEINPVSEKSGFRRVSLFVIIIRIILSA